MPRLCLWYRTAFAELHLELHLLQAGCVRWGERQPWARVTFVVCGLAALWFTYLMLLAVLLVPALLSSAVWHLWNACSVPGLATTRSAEALDS